MAGYQTIEALRPILHRGPPPTPVVDRALFYKPRFRHSPTLADIRAMVALREKGVPQKVIAYKLGFSRTTVQTYIKDVPPPPGGWRKGGQKSKLNRPFAERLKRAGFTYREIAQELGCCEKSAENLIKGHPTTLRKGGQHRASKQCEDLVSFITGYTVQQLRRTSADSQRPSGDKARLILQWLVRFKRPDLSYAEIAKLLGGYNPTTCSHAYRRVSDVVEALGIRTNSQTGRLVKALWEAEWPKASV